ncbi:hypothetical protein FACS1894217_04150 [Clostridia bacterium]|nr:hypothetical protein FACS1894217_04150 [Clostridia bacterium]
MSLTRYDIWNVKPGQDGGLITRVMAARGLKSEDLIRHELYDPFLLPDMSAAANRVFRALEKREKIAIYGDFDADGVTACSLVCEYLRQRDADCLCYIPNRAQGYGVHVSSLEKLIRDHGVSLIITVDVGSTAFDAAEYLKTQDVDLVITDHHACRDTLPDAAAVVNPHRADSVYPYTELAGAGVAFKLVCAVESLFDLPDGAEQIFARYGDLAAIGTIADSVPLTGENRAIAAAGLKHMDKRPGIKALLTAAGASDRALDEQLVGYTIAPIINAAGRMAHARTAGRLLLGQDPVECNAIAQTLIDLNNQRRTVELEIFNQACRKIKDAEAHAIVLADTNWHQGVIGIVASRLADKYRKPVFLIARDGEQGKGSARGLPGGRPLSAVLAGCADCLINFGGHDRAAGFSLDYSRVDEFRARVNEVIGESAEAGRELDIDTIARWNELTLASAYELARLGPYGAGNPEPVLMVENARVTGITPMGGGKHCRLAVSAEDMPLTIVAFGYRAEDFEVARPIDMAVTLGVNNFRGKTSVQIGLRDFRWHD